jgi:lauroyl/myristoyl acyltransferase
VKVDLFGKPFAASIAAADLARATGCALLPVCVPREADGRYHAHVLPEIAYDRRSLGSREIRQQLTQEIMGVFEPVIRRYLSQWYHFIPIWPKEMS